MVPNTFRVLLDANVIYRAVLRDVLLWSAAADHYRVFWSAQILDEATRNLVANGTMPEANAQRLATAMNAYFPEAMVTDYERLIDAMPNDPKDRHVAAAAVRADAQVIVTLNLKDFVPLPDGISAQSPDEFLCYLFDLFGTDMLQHLEEQVTAHRRPPRTLDEILTALASVTPEFVAAVRGMLAQ